MEGRGRRASHGQPPARGAARAGPPAGAAGAPGAAAGGQQLAKLLDPPHPEPEAPQEPGNQEEDLPVFSPTTPAWLRLGAPAAIPAESGRADGVVALACMMRTPVDPDSEIRRTIYRMDGIAPGFLRGRRSWEECIPSEEDEIGTSGGGGGSETGTWKTVDDDGRFPSLVDLFLRHGGLSKPSRSSSEASRRTPTRRWRTGVPTGSASGPPPTRPNPISSWTTGRRPRSGSTSRSFACG